jgi:LacI family transcriptional regulator
MSRPTLALVAERSGYSVATVSRALHNDSAVTPETRARIMEICGEVGYRPSIAGRHLSQGSKAVVGLSLGGKDYAASRFVSLMHQALSASLAASGWSVQLITSGEFDEDIDVGGLILLGLLRDDPRLASNVTQRIPTVAIGHYGDCFRVAPDDATGGRLAAEHLIATGRRKLAVLQLHESDGSTALRVEAFAAAAEKLGHPVQRLDVEAAGTPSLQGYRTMAHRIRDGLGFDGLFCETDELALGALTALEDAGIAVPDTVALVGFDDLPALSTRLTTIRQVIPAMADAAIELLNEAKRGHEPRHMLMPVSLVRRETT